MMLLVNQTATIFSRRHGIMMAATVTSGRRALWTGLEIRGREKELLPTTRTRF
jgi:hypothetical protein